MKETFKIPAFNFPRNFQFGYCGSSDNPSAFI